MTTRHYIKHPIKATQLGRVVLRARLSLGETQSEFAQRFQIAVSTLHNWETGKTQYIQKIHRAILEKLLVTLKRDGLYLPEEIMEVIYREHVEKVGDAVR